MIVEDPPVWFERQDQLGSWATSLRRAFTGIPSRPGKAWAGVISVSLVALTWAAVVWSGRTNTHIADIGYVPAIVAAIYFGVPGGIATGAVMTLLVSPLGPLNPDLLTSIWIAHSAITIGLGCAVGAWSFDLDLKHRQVRALLQQLSTTYQQTLHQIAEAVELRDPITAGHSRRVAINARKLGERLGLARSDLDTLYWAGLLHDVGKIAIPEPVLQKPGPLDDSERAVMRSHSEIGAKLIRETSSDLVHIASAVASHHECWDGTGYPSHLVREEAPLSARILAIVDVFEALTSSRPYRAPLSVESAYTYIVDRSGTQFDPSIVGTFSELIAEHALLLAPDP